MSHGTCGVSMDFHSLDKFGMDSHKKIIQRPTLKPVKRKNLNLGLTKQELGFWDDVEGIEFCKSFDNCSIVMEGGDADSKLNDGSDTEVVYKQGGSDDDTTKKSDSSPIIPTSQEQAGDEVKLHPEKDSEFDSNTSSPVTAKPAVTARNTRYSTTGHGAKSKLQQSLKEQRKTVSAVISTKKEEEKLCYIREFQSNSNVLYLINCGNKSKSFLSCISFILVSQHRVQVSCTSSYTLKI